MLPPIVTNLLIEALKVVSFAGFFFVVGYCVRADVEADKQTKSVVAARVKDVLAVKDALVIDTALITQRTQTEDAAQTALQALPHIVPTVVVQRPTPSHEDPISSLDRRADADPRISLDAIRLLNAARSGDAIGAAAVLHDARRTAPVAAD